MKSFKIDFILFYLKKPRCMSKISCLEMTVVLVLTLATLGICGVNRSINDMFGIKKQGVAKYGVFRILLGL